MKKLFLTSLCTMLSFGAFAADTQPQPPMEGHRGGMPMAQLTEEQKSCVEAYGCKIPEMGDKAPKGEKPNKGERPEMTAEQKEAMDCMQKAMKECGVEMPQRPEHPQGERPNMPQNN